MSCFARERMTEQVDGYDDVGFSRQIMPLFREEDRAQMVFAFDLWAYDDVKENAEAILERLEDGTMPCDAPWQTESIASFRRWIDGGCRP
jgi:hypothetical protein